MYKTLLVAALLVTGTPLAALSVSEALDAADAEEHEGIERSEDGHRIVVTEEALDGTTGYVLVTISVASETRATLEQDAELNASTTGDAAMASLWHPAYRSTPSVWFTGSDRDLAEVSVADREASLGGAGSSSASGTGETSLEPGEPLTIGLLAQDLPRDAHFRWVLETEDAPMEIEHVRTGSAVQVVDLVDAAYPSENGAQLGEDPLIGGARDVHRSPQATGNGLLAVESWVEGDARAKLSLDLANGTSMDNGNGRNVSAFASGLVGTQRVDVHLTDVHQPSWLDQRQRNLETALGQREHDGSAFLEARVLFADLPLEGSALRTDVDSTVQPEVPVDERTLTLTEDELPGPTGWFVARLEADRNATIDVSVELNLSADGPEALLPLVLEPGHGPYLDGPGMGQTIPVFSASHDGTEVSCCTDRQEDPPFSSGWRTGSFDTAFIGPDRPLYVGLVTVGLEDDSVTIHARPNGTHSPDAKLTVADVRAGDQVHLVDLLEEADEQGTAVEVFGSGIVRRPADVHRSFEFDHAGLVTAQALFEDQSQGKLALTLPNGSTIDNGNGRNVETWVSALTGPGTFEVDLSDVERASPADRFQDDRSRAEAQLLVADIELPLRGLTVWQEPVED